MKAKLILLLLIIAGIANPLLENVSAQETSTLPITAIGWSPDESRIALDRSNGVVEILDGQTHNTLLSIKHGETEFYSIGWSSDGSLLASSDASYDIKIWNSYTGQLVHTLHHEHEVLSFVFTTNGKQIISIDYQPSYNLYIWDAELGIIVGHTLAAGGIVQMDWSPDGRQLTGANAAGGIEFRDGNSLEYLKYFEHPEVTKSGLIDGFDVYAIDWNPDGSQIASGSLNGKVRVWDVETGEIILDLEGNENEEVGFDTSNIRDIGFSTDGERLYSISADGTIRVWDTGNGEIIRTIALDKAVRSADFNQERSLVAVGYQSGEFAVIATEPEFE